METVFLTVLTVVASAIGTLSGFGTSTIMVPALGLVYPLTTTLLLVGIIHWFGNIWKLALFKKGIRWKFILLFGIPGVISTYIGARFVFEISAVLLSKLLGLFLLLYAAYLFINPTFRIPKSNKVSVVGGALYGLSSGIFGVGGAIRGAFLSAFNLPKEVYIATSGAIGLAVDAARVGTYVVEGATLGRNLWLGLLIFIPASFIGAKIAHRVVGKISQKGFRQVVAVFLAAVSLLMLFKK